MAVATGVAVAPSGAVAEPRPSLAEVERRVDALNTEVERLAEDYNEARLVLQTAARAGAAAKARVAREQAKLEQARATLSAVLAGAYRSGGTDAAVSLIGTTDPQVFLDRASSLEVLARSQADQLADVAVVRKRLADLQAAADRQEQAQRDIQSRIDARKSDIEKKLREQQGLLSGLRADERRRYAAARASRERAAAPRATYNGPASGRAAVAVREAYAQLGKPYKWGAAGPDRFDCSGLTMWVWGKAGVSLPHNSRAQFASGRKVARNDWQPGDLLYFGSPIHHVAIYVGGGKMISAPQTGDVVKLRGAQRNDYAGATRP
ncbi:MAG: NlpC/P60 family protein [Mycobacteriales bacterium]|nr:NlpC/P60 family protein [Mycobacteriales bacterium]